MEPARRLPVLAELPRAAVPRTVCLIKPPTVVAPRSLSYFGSVPSLGLAYVAAALRGAGHRVSVIDAPGEAWERHWDLPTSIGTLRGQGLRPEQIVERLPADVEVVGVTHMFLHEWGLLRELLPAIRRRAPRALIVAGGENASAFWETMLHECAALDACVCGEGEATVLELVEAWTAGRPLPEVPGVAARHEGRPRLGPARARLRELDRWPEPAWDLFPLEPYLRGRGHGGVARGRSLPVLTTRGCPYRCTFCSSPSMWTTRYERRDPARVADEIEALVRRYGIRNVDLQDLTALLTKRWLLELCDELRARRLGVTWQMPSGTRCEAIDDEAAARLHEAGCRNVCYAPESGSPEVLRRIAKRVHLDALLDSLRGAVAAGLRTEANLIIGFPHEQEAELWQSARLAARLAWVGLHSLSVMVFAPYPGSEEYRRLLEQGRIEIDDGYLYGTLLRSAGALRSYHPRLDARRLLAIQLGLLLGFFALQYARRPWRLASLLGNVATGREQTVVDQFVATKARQLEQGLRMQLAASAASRVRERGEAWLRRLRSVLGARRLAGPRTR